jgi:DNA-binding transcriptional LysR family regulator
LFLAQQCFKSIAAMELRHLRYFVSVAELLNFTKAAAKLRVAQPSLSRQIRDLEEELGVALFERNSRIVQLTDAGKDFVPEATAVLLRAQAAMESAKAFARGDRGKLHLGFAPSLTVEILPAILKAFERECPHVQVILHDLSIQEMILGLKQHRLNAALTLAPSPTVDGITFEPLRAYEICVALRRAHPLARLKSMNVADLEGERLLIYGRDEYPEYNEWLEAILKGLIASSHEEAEEHNSGPSLIAAIESGRGIAVVPSIIAAAAGARLQFRKLKPPPPPLVIGIAYQPDFLQPATQRFVNLAVTKRRL